MLETGHNCGDRASNEAVTTAIFSTAVKKDNIPQAMAALFPKPLTKRANND
jgi:hypothetical protein